MVSSGSDPRLTSLQAPQPAGATHDGVTAGSALVLVLLWEGGAVSWDETFGPWLEAVLKGARARIQGAAASAKEEGTGAAATTASVMLWLACESSAEPEETLSLLSKLVLEDRGLGRLGWSWCEQQGGGGGGGGGSLRSVCSESRRYVVAGIELRNSSAVAGC